MRISRDEWGLRLAEVTALRSTCARRRVGAVIVDEQGVVLATGYNGVPRGARHCTEVPCAGRGFASGEALDLCDAIHAEANAVAFTANVERIYTIYVTIAPCVSCVKLLLATACQRVVYRSDYAASGLDLWRRNMRDCKRKEPEL